ncbi:MAG: hypothetical protein JXA79_11260, partial [Deltaproteobacteria bacterium]|nr:hypothetical protein [Deltaproteobacteria bacterium]
TELTDDLFNINKLIKGVQEQIGKCMREKDPDEIKVDELQQEREILTRRKERVEIQLQAIKEQRPIAEKKDAEIIVHKKVAKLKELASSASESVSALEVAIFEVIGLAEGAYRPYIDSLSLSYDIDYIAHIN